ncbi:MAG: signal peptidase I, partial [Bacilli bacterium]|nr:signal peptidase I [Bacilli bacterium]
LRIIYPLIIFLYIDKYYSDGYLQVRKKDRKNEILSLGFTFVILTIFILIVSGKFSVGALVIGSNSMKGAINKGDIIIYKKDKNIKVEDVIVFQKDKYKIVHRVVDVKNINEEQRYYTKGDANRQKDDNYVTKDNYVGKVLFRIKYLGEPTLWLKNIFK